jgi:hypothetical protein
MTQELVEEMMVFAGLMATLASITKIILSAIGKRRPLPDGSAATLTEISQRLARLEQGVDATAIEVERISEAQRFTTKLLVEKGHAASPESARRVVTPH